MIIYMYKYNERSVQSRRANISLRGRETYASDAIFLPSRFLCSNEGSEFDTSNDRLIFLKQRRKKIEERERKHETRLNTPIARS